MLRKVTRWIFGLNAAYQGAVGIAALLFPAVTIAFYGGGAADQASLYMHALYRMIGALLVFVALISALIAKDPDGSPLLVLFMGILSVLTLFTWFLALGSGDVTWAQVSFDIIAQLPVIIASALYYPRAKRQTMDTLELLMTGELRDEIRRQRGWDEAGMEAVRRREMP